MAFKFVTLCALIAAANAGFIAPQIYHTAPGLAAAPLAYAAPAVAKVASPLLATKAIDADYDPHPQYSYAYDVQDSITGDYKSQHETRDGDIVHGSYSLLEADGTRRIVDYTADSHNGFNAVVHKEPATKVALATSIAPVAKIATPALTYGAPPAIAAPVAPVTHATATYAVPPTFSYGPPSAAVAKFATPIAATYTSAHATLAEPVAKLAAPISTAPVLAKFAPHPYISHLTYTTPLFSYSH